MKHIFLIFLLLLEVQVNAATKLSSCTIKGKVSDVDSGFVLIRNLTMPVMDTVKITKGQFTYTGKCSEASPFIISDDANHYQIFFAEPKAIIHIELSKKNMQFISIDGSTSHQIFQELLSAQDPLQKAMEQLNQIGAQPNANHDSLQKIGMQINAQRNNNFSNFLKTHGNSEVAAFVIYSSISQDRNIDARLADSLFSFLNGVGKTCFYGVESQKSVTKLKAITIGFVAPDFTLPDTTGKKKFTLSQFRGKYLLIDFWASWCGPCKAEIPFIKDAYAHFHDKGFDVLSVSLDDKREAWLAAVKQFEMPWTQVSDSKGFRSVVNDLYPIPSIPKTLLLDKEGKIIATDLRGQALDQKLEELLGK